MIEQTDPRLMTDPRYRALYDAQRTWKATFMLNSKERIIYLRQLHEHQMFSLNQLAKICRVSVATASRKLPANSGGGRFAPETLTSLMQIRRAVLSNERLQKYMVRQCVDAGTSLGSIAKLTGASTTTVYRVLNS